MTGKKRLLILHCYCVYHRGIIYTEYPEYAQVYESQLRESFRLINDGAYDVLVISGGYTKDKVEKSEARGMLDWAEDLGLWPAKKGIVLLEEYAKDSFENILFSLCRFFQYFGEFPASVASCTWKFNIKRFEIFAKKLHISNFNVVPVGEKEDQEEVAQKWAEIASEDPLYCKQPGSKEKYLRRDPWKKNHPYALINEDFLKLFAKLNEVKMEGSSLEKVKSLFPWRNLDDP